MEAESSRAEPHLLKRMNISANVPYVARRLVTRTTWQRIWGPTLAKNRTNVRSVISLSANQAILFCTCAYTQARSRMHVLCAKRLSASLAIWQSMCASTRVNGRTCAAYAARRLWHQMLSTIMCVYIPIIGPSPAACAQRASSRPVL